MVIPDDFIEAVAGLPAADRERLLMAAVDFACTGGEPALDGWHAAVFAAARRSIVKANNLSRSGGKGGKAKKAAAPGGKAEPESDRRAESENARQAKSENACQAKSENACQAKSENACGEKNRTERNGKEKNEGTRAGAGAGGCEGEGPEPPTLEEVRAFFACSALKGDPEVFFLTYDAQGWVRGNGQPIVSWHSQALKWSRDQVQRDHDAQARGEPPRGPAFAPPKSDAERLAELEAEARERGWLDDGGEVR